MASVCSCGLCAFIGVLSLSARADVIVSCEIRFETESCRLVGVEERVFDPDVLYSSPTQIRRMSVFLGEEVVQDRFLSGYVVDEGLYEVQSHEEMLEVETIELEWQDLVLETDGALVDVPALIQWNERVETHPATLGPMNQTPMEQMQLSEPTTFLEIGLSG